MLEISVIIPTRNRAALLETCLLSLLQQTVAADRYEICVVNNASTDTTRERVASLATRFPQHHLRIVDEPKLGLSYARNSGLENTHAPLVAYGDDDATMPPDWVERYLARFASLPPDVVKIGGEIIPDWETPRPEWLSDAMMCLLTAHSSILSAEARLCHKGEILVECNCCYRREDLARMGGFPTTLGRKGGNLLSGDSAVDYRLWAEGGKFFYDPDITIRHRIHADRLTPDWFCRRYFWQGITDFAVRQYLERHRVPTPASHVLAVPVSQADWAAIGSGAIENFDDQLQKIRGIGFMMAMAGAIGED